MIRRSALALVAVSVLSVLSSAKPFEAPGPYRLLAREIERLSIYDQAVLGTCVPASLLRAVAIVESAERDDAIGPDGLDLGRYQLRALFHAERAERWGKHDPRDARQAGHIAARVLEEAYLELGDWDRAIAAYRQGARGVREDGAAWWYVRRVRRAMK